MKSRLYLNRIFVSAVIILLLIFLYFIGVLSPIQNLIVSIFQPASSLIFKASIITDRALFSTRISKSDLLKDVQKLRQEINNFLVQKAELETLRDENASLKKIINFVEENEYKYVVAKIIAKDPNQDFEAVTINKGTKDSISKNQVVVNEEGIVVGKIYKVNDSFSSVLFLTDNRAKLAVTILNKDRASGLLEGRLGLVSWVNFIPQDADLNVGDLVVTNGLEENIPFGLVVGQVEEIFEKPDQLFKSAKIKQNFQYNQLNLINVIRQEHD